MMSPATHPAFEAHEEVKVVTDAATGLAAIIAIHSTTLGPSAGGCRVWTYATDDDALGDALKLSRAMTYKNAMAELPLGGGKTVLYKLGPDRAACFEKLGEAIEALSGRYIAAEDVGATVADMRAIGRRTSYVTGIPKEHGQAGGDPSPWTALGVGETIKALLGGSVDGRSIAVQGVGAVGGDLCRRLAAEGAKLVIADVNTTHLARIAEDTGAEVAPVDQIHAVKADVFAPCALGGALNARTIPELGAAIVCGAANNQLETAEDGERLRQRGVTYAPDYVVNAGGIISVSAEYLGETEALVDARVRAIPARVQRVLDAAKAQSLTPQAAADAMVRARLTEGRR